MSLPESTSKHFFQIGNELIPHGDVHIGERTAAENYVLQGGGAQENREHLYHAVEDATARFPGGNNGGANSDFLKT